MFQRVSAFILVSMFLAACSSTPKNTADSAQPAQTKEASVDTAKAQDAAALQQAAAGQAANAEASVFFDFDKYAVKPEQRKAVEQNAARLKAHIDEKVTLQGNTDDRGSAEYNLALGEKRANAVHHMLAAMGVKANRIEDVSLGEEKPRASCEEEKCWQENRRVDFVFQGK